MAYRKKVFCLISTAHFVDNLSSTNVNKFYFFLKALCYNLVLLNMCTNKQNVLWNLIALY